MRYSRRWFFSGISLLVLLWGIEVRNVACEMKEERHGIPHSAFRIPHSPIVLSEVMFDPAGSEFYDEFVEVFNTSETEPVDLAGWTIGDGSEDDAVVPTGGGTVLGPRRFGLILDSGYLEQSTSYDPLPEDVLVLTIDDGAFGKSGWANSTPEPVILRDARGDTAAVYVYSIGNRPGRSDEKIVLEEGDAPENWADSVVDEGTPGRWNSLGVERIPVTADLSATPNPFDLLTVVSYRVPARTATVNLWVFDRQGRRVRRLLNGHMSGGEGFVVWDRCDDDGIRVKMGIYILYLEALDEGEGVVCIAKGTVAAARKGTG